MLGASQEDVDFDISQKPRIMQSIARCTVLSFAWLRELQIARAWAALRVMLLDGLPIYDQSTQGPGASLPIATTMSPLLQRMPMSWRR
jgi:hypothetical protein